jgi:heme exporter protein CcmD
MYVWPSYAITFAVVVLNIIWARRALTRSQAEALRKLAMRGEET